MKLDKSQDHFYRPTGPQIGGVQQGGPLGGGGQGGFGTAYPSNPSYSQQGNFRGQPQTGYDNRSGNQMGGNGHTTVIVQPSQPSVIYGGGGYGGGRRYSGDSLAMGNMCFVFFVK